jgi:hypothetical protein
MDPVPMTTTEHYQGEVQLPVSQLRTIALALALSPSSGEAIPSVSVMRVQVSTEQRGGNTYSHIRGQKIRGDWSTAPP